MFDNILGQSRRFVLVIGNAGAVLSYVAAGRVHRRWTIDEIDDASLEELAKALDKRRRVRLSVLVDVLEQSYRKEAIPPVSVLDRPKVLRRRLNIAYPAFDIKAAINLDEKVGERGDLAYLFVALPSSPELELWIAFLHSVSNPITSLALLPIESASLARALARASASPDARQGEWTILVTHQQTGGFRQIVARGGRLALTRLTPSPPADAPPDEIARTIQQELSATLGYLARLGYTASDGLDVIVIGSESLREGIQGANLPVSRTTVLTPAEAGELVGLAGVDDPAGNFGELLHAAWTAGRRRPALQLAAEALGRRQLQLLQARKWAVGGLSATAAVLAAICIYLFVDQGDLRGDVKSARTTVNGLENEIKQIESKIDTYPNLPKTIIAALNLHKELEAETVDPLESLAAIGASLDSTGRLTGLIWKIEGGGITGGRRARSRARQPGDAPSTIINIVIDVELSGLTDRDRAVAKTNALAKRLRERFTEQKVEVDRPPVDILPTQTFTGSSSETEQAGEPPELSAGITISGPAG